MKKSPRFRDYDADTIRISGFVQYYALCSVDETTFFYRKGLIHVI